MGKSCFCVVRAVVCADLCLIQALQKVNADAGAHAVSLGVIPDTLLSDTPEVVSTRELAACHLHRTLITQTEVLCALSLEKKGAKQERRLVKAMSDIESAESKFVKAYPKTSRDHLWSVLTMPSLKGEVNSKLYSLRMQAAKQMEKRPRKHYGRGYDGIG